MPKPVYREAEQKAKAGRRKRAGRKELLDALISKDPALWYLNRSARKVTLEAFNSSSLYRLVQGPNRSGKTTLALAELSLFMRGIHPVRPSWGASKGFLVIPGRSQGATVWGPRLLKASCIYGNKVLHDVPYLPEDEVEKVEYGDSVMGDSPLWIRMKNGSELYVILGDVPMTWKRVEGMDVDYIVRDELLGSENLGATLMMRTADAYQASLDGVKPGAGWVLWTGTEMVEDREVREFRRRCEDEQEHYSLFRLPPDENPAVRDEARRHFAQQMSKDNAAVRVWGTADASRLHLTYPQFSKERHIMRGDFNLGPQDNIIAVFDPGFANPFGIGVFVITPSRPDCFQGIAYFEVSRLSGRVVTKMLHDFLGGNSLSHVVYDPAAHQVEKGTGCPLIETVVRWFEEEGIVVLGDFIPGYNRQEAGFELVRDHLDPDPGNPDAPPRLVFWERGPNMADQIELLMDYNGKAPKKKADALDTYPDLVRYLCTTNLVWDAIPPHMNIGRPVSGSELSAVDHLTRVKMIAAMDTDDDDGELFYGRFASY